MKRLRVTNLCADAQAHPAILLGPEDPLPLKIDMLQLLVALVGEGHHIAIVRLLSGQLAFSAGGCKMTTDIAPTVRHVLRPSLHTP